MQIVWAVVELSIGYHVPFERSTKTARCANMGLGDLCVLSLDSETGTIKVLIS